MADFSDFVTAPTAKGKASSASGDPFAAFGPVSSDEPLQERGFEFDQAKLDKENKDQLWADLFGVQGTEGRSVKGAAKAVGAEFAAFGDLVASLPAQAGAVAGDFLGRADKIVSGGTRKEATDQGRAVSAKIMETFGSPIQQALKGMGIDLGDDSAVNKGMAKLSSWIKQGAEVVEKKTGGAMLAGDVESMVDMGMTILGTRGVKATVDKLMDPKAFKASTGFKPKDLPKAAEGSQFRSPDYGLPAKVLQIEGPKVKAQTQASSAWELDSTRRPGEAAPEVMEESPNGYNAPGVPKLAAAGAATGLGAYAASQLDDDEQKVAAAAATGLAFIPGRRGLSMAELAKENPASALGVLLSKSEYTLKTLDRLPQNKTEFSVDYIKQELKRADVTDAERGVLTQALEEAKDGKITAKDLMIGVKKATGNFELEPKATSDYATYGLDRIDRVTEESRDIDAWNDMTAQERVLVPEGETPATTTLYRLPEHMAISDANHFSDPNLFGWTRSFEEGGVRHVVEIQSDLAQHAKGAAESVSPEMVPVLLERAQEARALGEFRGRGTGVHISSPDWFSNLQLDLADLRKLDSNFDQMFADRLARQGVGNIDWAAPRIIDTALAAAEQERPSTTASGVRNLAGDTSMRRIINGALSDVRAAANLRAQELTNKVNATAVGSQLSPIIKSWPKRLIREELGEAAKRGEETVRFATADTVKKVEGWPEREPDIVGRVAARKRDLQVAQNSLDDYKRLVAPEADHTGRPFDADQRAAQADQIRFKSLRVEQVKREYEQLAAQLEEKKAAGEDLSPQLSPEHASIYKRYGSDIEKFLKQQGGKPYTDPAGHTWLEVPVPRKGPKQMMGGASTDLMIKMAAAGGGAALGYWLNEDPGQAVLGGLAGLALTSRGAAKAAGEAVHGLDKGLGLISTRIKNISEPMLHRAREYERRVLTDTHARIAAVDPFLRGLNKLKNPQLELAIKTNDAARVAALMPAALLAEWQKVQQTLKDVGDFLVKYDRLSTLRQDYFPRIVKDREGLLKALGSQMKTQLEERIAKATLKAVQAGQGGLTAAEESVIINRFLQENSRGDTPGFTKMRQVGNVTVDLDQFYASNADALHSYLRSATQSIEKSKFFGRDAVTKTLDGQPTLDINGSIGRVVNEEMAKGKMTAKQADDLASILRSRFVEQPTAGLVTDFKNLANLGLLGNVISAATQLGDLATAVYMEGFRPGMEGLVRALTRTGQVHMKDFGLVDHLSEEFVSSRRSTKLLNTAFKLAGFAGIDALGKNTLLNAALVKYQKLAQTKAGELKIAAKYAQMFGADYPKLITELQSRTMGEQTRAMLFGELSDAQPITKLEVPQKYLDMPNGRVLYMLKTFMLKQADIVRRDAYNEIKKGNVAKGLGNLGKFAIALGVSGAATDAVKDWLLGRPIDLGPGAIAMNMIKTFGLTEYVLDKARGNLKKDGTRSGGNPIQAILGMAVPPFKMMDEIIRMDPKAARYIPFVGPLIDAHLMGGSDRAWARSVKPGQTPTPEQAAAKRRIRERKARQKAEAAARR